MQPAVLRYKSFLVESRLQSTACSSTLLYTTITWSSRLAVWLAACVTGQTDGSLLVWNSSSSLAVNEMRGTCRFDCSLFMQLYQCPVMHRPSVSLNFPSRRESRTRVEQRILTKDVFTGIMQERLSRRSVNGFVFFISSNRFTRIAIYCLIRRR